MTYPIFLTFLSIFYTALYLRIFPARLLEYGAGWHFYLPFFFLAVIGRQFLLMAGYEM